MGNLTIRARVVIMEDGRSCYKIFGNHYGHITRMMKETA
jgi:hypothetical protein